MCLDVAIDRPEDVLGKGEHVGYEWMIMDNGSGVRCGYLRVPAGHPWHGKAYDEVECEAHGGLTFAGMDKPCDQPGKDDAYWFGFDCGHAGDLRDPDLMPPEKAEGEAKHNMDFLKRLDPNAIVRSQEYVEKQCKSLCEQAYAEAKRNDGLTDSEIESMADWLQAR